MLPADLNSLPSIDNLDTATAMMFGLQMKPGQIPGQYLDTQNGVIPSTIYNKPPSHPDVEAVKGKLVYSPKKDSAPIDELRAEKDELANTVITMQAQIQALMGGAVAPVATAAPEPTADVSAMQAQIDKLTADNKKLVSNANLAKARAAKGGKKKVGTKATAA